MHTARVAGIGRNACGLAAELRKVRARWNGPARTGEAACGMDTTRAAYTAMQEAWFAEVGLHITILEQLCAALKTSATSYEEADISVAVGLRSATYGD
ncbi:hypothetical protein [Actinokineospora sp. HUAS TT18]|uniref:hypothetical protein n=1 Tax=Actinokineospora sp. HUAS TT18 TaxID=3447451 RepID=UPI003F523E50